MRIEFLGSGGAVPTPRPGCTCHVCSEAREKGVPYSRMGPSVFVHGPDVLIDTPEEARLQVDRSSVSAIPACFYSHWHPDHVRGCRLFETMNVDWLNLPPRCATTAVYVPQKVVEDFRERVEVWDSFKYLERWGAVRLVEVADGSEVTLNGWTIRPFRLAAGFVYAFLFDNGQQRVLIAPDELVGWTPGDDVCGLDMAVIPMGITEFHPLTGERIIPEAHPILKAEATFRQTLAIVERLQAKIVIMTHIEEPFHLSYDDLLRLQEKLQAEGYPITFAYDTLIVDV